MTFEQFILSVQESTILTSVLLVVLAVWLTTGFVSALVIQGHSVARARSPCAKAMLYWVIGVPIGLTLGAFCYFWLIDPTIHTRPGLPF